MKYLKTKQGTVLGCSILKLDAVPDYELLSQDPERAWQQVGESFGNMLQELARFSAPNGSVLEILWIGEPVKNQTYRSRVQIYFVLRVMERTEALAAQRERTILKNVTAHLEHLNFRYRMVQADDLGLRSGLNQSTHPCMTAVVKTEQKSASARTLLPYYHVNPMGVADRNSLHMFVNTLSSLNGGTVSFQLIPANFTEQERYVFHEYSAQLAQALHGNPAQGAVGDAMAELPLKAINYYKESVTQPAFLYNILVMGTPESCVALNAQICSLIKSQENGSFSTINLSNAGIVPEKDFMFYPWNVNHLLMTRMRNLTFFQTYPLFQGLMRLPYLVTVKEASSFFRLPVDDGKMNGLSSTKIIKSKEQFSEKVVNAQNIQFGRLVVDGQSAPQIGCPPKAFTKHALIVGMPGSGKTTFSVYILLQFYKKGISFLAIEPTKAEYRAMIKAIPELQIFTPGNNRVSPFVINPFIPPKNITVEQYVPSLANAFKAAFDMPSPLDILFLKAIRESYLAYGWKDYSTADDPNVTCFGLHEFILIFKKLVEDSDYSKDVKGNMQSGGVFRLQNLIEQNSNIYDTIHSVPVEDLLSRPTVLELNSIDNQEQKSLLMALILIQVCIYTKHNQKGDGELKNAILIDEAHVLFGAEGDKNGTSNTTVKALQDMVAEIRSYGTSIIIADQLPSAVGERVVANTDIKVAFRLVQNRDKAIIADTTGMSEQSAGRLGKLDVGEAYVYFNQLEEPQLVKTPDIRAQEQICLSVEDWEVREREQYWLAHKHLLIPFSQCAHSRSCLSCDFKIRSDAEYYANCYYRESVSHITDLISLDKYMRRIPAWLKQKNQEEKDMQRLCNCVVIRFLRKYLLNQRISITFRQQHKLLERSLNADTEAMEG